MRRLVPVVALALLAAGCGGGKTVTVTTTETVTRTITTTPAQKTTSGSTSSATGRSRPSRERSRRGHRRSVGALRRADGPRSGSSAHDRRTGSGRPGERLGGRASPARLHLIPARADEAGHDRNQELHARRFRGRDAGDPRRVALPFAAVSAPLRVTGTANTFEATFEYELNDPDRQGPLAQLRDRDLGQRHARHVRLHGPFEAPNGLGSWSSSSARPPTARASTWSRSR